MRTAATIIPEEFQEIYNRVLNGISEKYVGKNKHLILVEVVPADLAPIDDDRV